MLQRMLQPQRSRLLVLGLAFKEDCPDVRNTKVVDIICELAGFGIECDVYDPWVDPAEAKAEYGIDMIEEPAAGHYDGVVIAVGHKQFRDLGEKGIKAFGKPEAIIYDVKYLLPAGGSDDRL